MSKYIWKMFLWNNTKVLLSGSCAKLCLVLADTGTKITTSSPTKKSNTSYYNSYKSACPRRQELVFFFKTELYGIKTELLFQ